MRSRWMTIGIALAALMLTLPVVALAQTSRVEGMALQGDYIKDYTGIYTYPSCLSTVGNLMYAELGNNLNNLNNQPTTLDRSVGAVMDKLFDGRWGTWGIHLRQETPEFGQGDAFSTPGAGNGGGDPNVNANESFDLMWGRKSGTTSLGLRLNRSQQKFTDQTAAATTILPLAFSAPTVGNLARNIMGFGAGVGFQMNPQTNVEIGGQYQSRTFENSSTTGAGYKNTDNGGGNYQVAARAMYQWKPNVMVVPVIKTSSFDLSQKNVAGAVVTQFDNTLHSWQAGVSCDWTLGTNDMMVWGLTFAQNKLEQEQDLFGIMALAGFAAPGDKAVITETLTPQVFAALETHVNNWLTLRFGANKGAFQSVKLEDKVTGETRKQQFAGFNMNIGAGVKVGQLQLDAILANNFPQTMGWLGSGNVAPNGYFPKVTATYPF